MLGSPPLAPAVIRETAVHPEDDEQRSKDQGDEEETGEELAHVALFIGGTGKGLIGWKRR
jgi:hypothetical protein